MQEDKVNAGEVAREEHAVGLIVEGGRSLRPRRLAASFPNSIRFIRMLFGNSMDTLHQYLIIDFHAMFSFTVP